MDFLRNFYGEAQLQPISVKAEFLKEAGDWPMWMCALQEGTEMQL